MSKCLVTGATGFLGRHLLELLLTEKQEVVVLSRRPLPELEERGVKVEIGDVLEQSTVLKAAKGCEQLYHCAGMVSRDPEDTLKMMKVNFDGTCNVLDAAKEAGIKRVVYMSTSGTIAITDDGDIYPDERYPTPYAIIGRWGYYRSKLYAEQEALKRNSDDFEVICLNPSILLGPGDVNGSSTEDVQMFLEKKIPATPSGGLSFADVRDVAEMAVVAMKKGSPGKRYLLGSTNMTFADYFGRLSRLSGVSAPRLPAPKNHFLASLGGRLYQKLQDSVGGEDGPDQVSVDMSQFFWYLDSELAEKDLGFQPRELMSTLKDTIQDLLDRGVVWPLDWMEQQPSGLERHLESTESAVRDAITSGVMGLLNRGDR